MKVTYDPSVDAAYIYLTDDVMTRAEHTYPCDPIEVDGEINLDFDEAGRLIGIEVIGARHKLPPEVLELARGPGPFDR